VYAIARDTQKAEALFKHSHVKVVGASVTEMRSLKQIPKYARIFHCAAIIGSLQAKKEAYEQVNVMGTINMLHAALEREAKSFTFVSSVSAVGAIGTVDNPITEKTISVPGTFYGKSKYLAENMILKMAPASMPVTIIRPSLIYGMGHRSSSGAGALFKLCKQNIFPVIGNAESLIPLVYVKNVVSGLIDLTFSHSGHEVFNVSDLNPYSLKKLADIFGGTKKKKYIEIPHSMAYVVSAISEGFSHLLQKDFGLRSEVIKALSCSGFVMNIDKALQFGYSPQETDNIIKSL
jgi:nucleoside-diphosphate-sugar epimerase